MEGARSGSGASVAGSGLCPGDELRERERVAHAAPAVPERARLQERQVRHQRPAQGRRRGGPGTPLHRHRTGLPPPLPALRWAGPDRLAGGRGDAAAGATSLEAAGRSGVEAAGEMWWCLATKARREVAVACWAYRRLRSSGLSLCGLLLEGLRDQKRSRTAVGARRPLRFSGGETFDS